MMDTQYTCQGVAPAHRSEHNGSAEQRAVRRKVWPNKNETARLGRVDADRSSWARVAFPRHPLAPLGINFLPGFPSFDSSGTRAVEWQRLVVTLCDSSLRERSCREGEWSTWPLCGEDRELRCTPASLGLLVSLCTAGCLSLPYTLRERLRGGIEHHFD